ncbi:MAG: peptide deformylase [Xanthomonadales bacterium]|nr:peptide deformylase [Xanthomonadales bacterium]
MATLEILEYPDPRLRTEARPVEEVTDETRTLVANMFETMYAAPGIGLAATQVDVHQQIIVVDVSEDQSESLCLINPEIVAADGHQIYEEGCLSVPNIYAKVERANEITVRALDRDGQPLELQASGLLAVCIQHEMDHLIGKLFVDYLSPLKRQRVIKKLEKQRKVA